MANIIPTASLASMATTFAASGTHISVGTGTSTPSLTSSTAQLFATESDRNAVTINTSSGATATFEAFFTTSEPSSSATTVVTELGLYTAAKGLTAPVSGTLLVHAQPVIAVSKTINKTMLVTITVTFANA